MTLQDQLQQQQKEKEMLENDMLKKSEIKKAMKEFDYMTIYQKTMSVAICNLLGEKGFKNTK